MFLTEITEKNFCLWFLTTVDSIFNTRNKYPHKTAEVPGYISQTLKPRFHFFQFNSMVH